MKKMNFNLANIIYSIKHHSVFTFLIIATPIILCSITSCSGNKQQSDEPFIINLSEGLDKVEEIRLSDLLTDITYIPLETSEACLIGPFFEKIITGEFIVVISQGCYLFDKGSGKFVREIGKVGRGPGEIRAFRFFHQPTGILYFESAVRNQLLRYSLDGSFLGTIDIPVSPPSTLGDITFLNDSLLVCYFLNVTGGEKNLAAIFSQIGRAHV